MPPRITTEAGRAALGAVAEGTAGRPETATAVRYLLQLLAEKAPGATVEVRVPPFGATQIIEGPRHTIVVEMDAATFIDLATGVRGWSDAETSGALRASGVRADFSHLLPLRP